MIIVDVLVARSIFLLIILLDVLIVGITILTARFVRTWIHTVYVKIIIWWIHLLKNVLNAIQHAKTSVLIADALEIYNTVI